MKTDTAYLLCKILNLFHKFDFLLSFKLFTNECTQQLKKKAFKYSNLKKREKLI